MPRSPGDPAASGPAPRSWLRRIAWFIGLWLAGVTVVGALALLIRLWLRA